MLRKQQQQQQLSSSNSDSDEVGPRRTAFLIVVLNQFCFYFTAVISVCFVNALLDSSGLMVFSLWSQLHECIL